MEQLENLLVDCATQQPFVAVVVAATDLGVGRVWCRVWDAVGNLQPAAHHAPFIVRLLDSDDDSHG